MHEIFIVQTRDTKYNYNWENIIAYTNKKKADEHIAYLSKEFNMNKEYRVDKLNVVESKDK